MRSFLALGDVGVYGLLGSGLEHSHFAGGHPAIFEGAALVGVSLEHALAPLHDSETPIRICRYLTPLDKHPGGEPYPFGTYTSFDGKIDPQARVNATWRLSGTSLDGAPERWRLTEERSAPVHPFGVHSRKLLESLRPGGLFEFTEAQRNLRNAYYDLRTCYLLWAINMSLPDRRFANDVESEFQKTCERIKKENPGVEFRANSSSPVNAEGIRTWMQDVFCEYRKQPCSQMAETPDVTILYDLYEGSRTRNPLSTPHNKPYSTGLRHVPVPQGYTGIEAEAQKVATDLNQPEMYEKNDALHLLKSLATLTYANLLNEAFNLAKKLQDSNGSSLAIDPETITTANLVRNACKDVVELYCRELVNRDLESSDYKAAIPEWKTWLNGNWVNDSVGDASHTVRTMSGNDRHPLFDACIRMTIRRLSMSRLKPQQNQFPVAEPLIVCCLKTLQMPDLSRSASQGVNQRDYLNSLYQDEWLRSRTVVILDADYLRTLKKGPAGISSELSWEETALDTVEAFQRRDHLRPYLDFGFLIIRYGVSGALLIGRQAGGILSATLFFDPKKSDRGWTSDESGAVISYTSIFAASIVQAMTVRCNERSNQPVYSDIHEVLNLAIRKSLERCQKVCAHGYGTPLSAAPVIEIKDKEWGFHRLVSNNGLLDNIFEQIWYPGVTSRSPDSSGAFAKYQEDIALASRLASKTFSSSVIPTTRTVRWSILAQSCSQDIEEVARQVAESGIDDTLNQIPPNRFDIISVLMRGCADTLQRHALSANSLTDVVAVVASAKTDMIKQVTDWLDSSLIKRTTAHDLQIRKAVLRSLTSKWTEDGESFDMYFSAVSKFISNVTALQSRRAHYEAELESACHKVAQGLRNSLRDSAVFDYLGNEVVSVYSAPIAMFGTKGRQITHIDRREIEGVSAVQRLLVHYVRDSEALIEKDSAIRPRPLSIAIFGPPGSGKSTIVKRIAEAQGEKIVASEEFEYNLSQFTDVTQLDKAFDAIAKMKGGIPLVFFDEFDSKFGETEFGWLKYFLAPMEDGKFGPHRFGPAVFIFAGGTSVTFSEFCPKAASPTDQRWIDFSLSKGPDFVSRLSGHLNIIGIDKTDPDDSLYLLRRAILVRDFLSRENGIDSAGRAKCDDPALLKAILQAPEYRYGGRSLRMLIKACLGPDNWLRRSSIPASHELDMMVDSKSFLSTLRDGVSSKAEETIS